MQENFTLNDWERRKAALDPLLLTAVGSGLVDEGRRERLAAFLLSRGVGVVAPVQAGNAEGLDAPVNPPSTQPLEDSEMPRFVRGFHDILITIGIMVGLGGLWGLASVYFVLPAVIVLSEILVRRQRLALPAFVLTGWFSFAVGFAIIALAVTFYDQKLDRWLPIIIWFALGVTMAAYYWRYQVPVALAVLLVSAAATVITTALLVLSPGLDYGAALSAKPGLGTLLLGLFAAMVFAAALFFDLADPARQTRRSDVAFWLHLVAAPAALYTAVSAIYIQTPDNWFGENTTLLQSALILVSVLVLMLAGVILDRRAFVTSGLLSLGYSVWTILEAGHFSALTQNFDRMFSLVMLLIGIVVLTLGIGWQFVRRLVLAILPEAMTDQLPPIRR